MMNEPFMEEAWEIARTIAAIDKQLLSSAAVEAIAKLAAMAQQQAVERLEAERQSDTARLDWMEGCAAMKALEETVKIERQYDLSDRVSAVMAAARAIHHIRADETLPFLVRINACELLNDGIANAIDGRSTGREFRTLRHSWRAKHDPQHFPAVSNSDRRCQRCGAINPPAFSHCRDHRPDLADLYCFEAGYRAARPSRKAAANSTKESA